MDTGGLTPAKAVKWMLVIIALPCFIRAYQGMVDRFTATGSRYRAPDLLTGDEALKFGLSNLVSGAIFLALAWAVWYFWERNEE